MNFHPAAYKNIAIVEARPRARGRRPVPKRRGGRADWWSIALAAAAGGVAGLIVVFSVGPTPSLSTRPMPAYRPVVEAPALPSAAAAFDPPAPPRDAPVGAAEPQLAASAPRVSPAVAAAVSRPVAPSAPPRGSPSHASASSFSPPSPGVAGNDISVAPAPQALAPFEPNAARAALQSVVPATAGCRAVSGPFGAARFAVTFSPRGTVTYAVVEQGPLLGSPVGSCVARAFRDARVVPFAGGPVTVRTTISIL